MTLPHVTRTVDQNTRPSCTLGLLSGNGQIWSDMIPPSPYPMQPHFHVGTFDTSSWTYAACHHWTDWTSLLLSHDLPTHRPTTTWQHATIRAPVECQMSITFLIPFQSLSCFPQPWSQCPLLSWEDSSGSDCPVVDPEWWHWNQPRTCWWVSGLRSMILNTKFRFQFISWVTWIIRSWNTIHHNNYWSTLGSLTSECLHHQMLSVLTLKDWSYVRVSLLIFNWSQQSHRMHS